ncbi:MAG: hypothetical protein IVW53_14265 [Chloroflexi bacterium]|nr:hypothetical protein [Chloroflexota bacterium]
MSDVLLGVIIGSLLSIAAGMLTEVVRGNRESRVDREKRADDRRLARDSFQRETLLRFQDALVDWARAGEEHHRADKTAFRESGEWGKNLVGEEMSNRELAANRNLSLLRSRIEDDELRARLGVCQGMSVRMLMAKDRSTAVALNIEMAPHLDWCLNRAGELIRALW